MSLKGVKAAHVEEYLHILGLKWKCRHCSSTKNLTRRGEVPPTVCENRECRALDSFEKVIRCVQGTVNGHRSALRVFFGWLKNVEDGIEVNPAPAPQRGKAEKKMGWRRTRKVAPSIQCYPWEVISALLKSIQDPKMPAEEAMVLYLLLHHACSLWNFKLCESLRSVFRQRSARNRLSHWKILCASNGVSGNFRETGSL